MASRRLRNPKPTMPARTLIAMAVLLGIMFLGITYLARTVQVMPMEHESVVSQIGRAVFGSGPCIWRYRPPRP